MNPIQQAVAAFPNLNIVAAFTPTLLPTTNSSIELLYIPTLTNFIKNDTPPHFVTLPDKVHVVAKPLPYAARLYQGPDIQDIALFFNKNTYIAPDFYPIFAELKHLIIKEVAANLRRTGISIQSVASAHALSNPTISSFYANLLLAFVENGYNIAAAIFEAEKAAPLTLNAAELCLKIANIVDTLPKNVTSSLQPEMENLIVDYILKKLKEQ